MHQVELIQIEVHLALETIRIELRRDGERVGRSNFSAAQPLSFRPFFLSQSTVRGLEDRDAVLEIVIPATDDLVTWSGGRRAVREEKEPSAQHDWLKRTCSIHRRRVGRTVAVEIDTLAVFQTEAELPSILRTRDSKADAYE